MCCCSSLAARRLPPARRCRRRRRSYYEAHQHGTGRDSWDTKGRRQPHGQIRIRRVGGRATRIRERPRGTLGWIDRQTFDVLHLRTQDANFPMAMGLAWAERRVVRGPTGPPCSSATDSTFCSIYCLSIWGFQSFQFFFYTNAIPIGGILPSCFLKKYEAQICSSERWYNKE